MLTPAQKAKRPNVGRGYWEENGEPHFAGEDFEISLFGPCNYLHGYGACLQFYDMDMSDEEVWAYFKRILNKLELPYHRNIRYFTPKEFGELYGDPEMHYFEVHFLSDPWGRFEQEESVWKRLCELGVTALKKLDRVYYKRG
ncbi:MAG: hypothetical protein HY710_09665 [Candidatus Latescibacteria bacterium]|nr:hypothetical protein [Candidatus Latescibacterota bacterium]